MLYTPLIRKAMQIAYQVHHGQFDRSGTPYVFHPFYVAELVSEVANEEIPVCTALLHDVLEDTDFTLEQLEREFPKEVTEAVMLLTHDTNTDYPDYVRRLKQNPTAALVKLMDIRHNMDESRLAGTDTVTEEQKTKWRKKYKGALEILT